MIEVQRQITVASAPDDVWHVLSDPAEVVQCIPGAVLDSQDENAFTGRMTIAFGGLRVPFKGSGTLELDPAAHTGTLAGQGKDNNGGTRFKIAADFAVTPSGGASLVDLTGRVDLAGKLSTLIEAGASVVVESMLTEFANNLAAASRSVAATVAGSDESPHTASTTATATKVTARIWLRGFVAAAGYLWRRLWLRTSRIDRGDDGRGAIGP